MTLSVKQFLSGICTEPEDFTDHMWFEYACMHACVKGYIYALTYGM